MHRVRFHCTAGKSSEQLKTVNTKARLGDASEHVMYETSSKRGHCRICSVSASTGGPVFKPRSPLRPQ